MASLRKRHGRRADIPLALTLCAIFLALGLLLPAVETRTLIWRNEFSILGNIQQMIRERKHSAAVILLFCCVGYPVIKLGILSFFWMFPFPATWRASSIALLHLLSRWSMIDVLAMTAIVLASMTIGPLQATPKPGLYFYALGIVLLTFTAMLMSRIAGARR